MKSFFKLFRNNKALKIIGKILITIAIFLLFFVIYLFIPSSPSRYENLSPITDYKLAIEKANESVNLDSDLVGDNCKSILLTHGEKTENVIVFFHGYTSCPGQFKELGELMYQQGYNVYIPRAPYHGYKDKATKEINKLTAKEYTDYAEKAVQLSHGLGSKVYISGLSGGGNLTSWIAINDKSIEKAIIISPGYGFNAIPQNLTTPVSKLFMILPSSYVLYNSNDKEGNPEGDVYAGYTTKSLAVVLSVGQDVYRKMLSKDISTKKISFIINDNDNQISLEAFKDVKKALEENKTVTFNSYTFDKSLGLGHDYIDPNFNGSTKADSYTKIVKVITN